MEENQNGEPIIPGTTYKTIEDVAKALQEKDQMIARHGNELGSLRTEKNTLLTTIEKLSQSGKPSEQAKPAGPDYGTELAEIDKAIDKLDPMSDKYQSELRTLIGKRTDLVAAMQHEKTLSAASEIFKKELNSRDAQMTQQKFLEENPTFNTPEVQARIKDIIAQDKTGMHDPLSAYFKLTADETRAKNQELAAALAEKEELLKLQQGKNSTGKVIGKGGSPQQKTQQTKLTGKDLDAAMLAALQP